MTMLVDGHEFALFAARQLQFWSELEGATLHHSEYGSGTVRQVKQRPGYIPLLTIVFEPRAYTTTFNSESFKTGKVSRVELPERLVQQFVQWKSGASRNQTTERMRMAYCWNCKGKIDNSLDAECDTCGWILCHCGACGCGLKA
jgi:hypothetical protein